MKRFFPLLIILLITACSSPALDMTEEEIDAYVESCLDPEKIYDINFGMRYSQDDKAYQVSEYRMNDTIILHNSIEETEFSQVNQNIFYKEGLPVFIEQYDWQFEDGGLNYTERKIYLTGDDVLIAYERSGDTDELTGKFEETEIEFESFDFDRPQDAVNQEGDFEMKFGDFLVINPESYLILENEKSGWGVALYILEGDMLLDQLFAQPEEYKGKTIEIHHEFMTMNGIQRMIYRGGIVKE